MEVLRSVPIYSVSIAANVGCKFDIAAMRSNNEIFTTLERNSMEVFAKGTVVKFDSLENWGDGSIAMLNKYLNRYNIKEEK